MQHRGNFRGPAKQAGIALVLYASGTLAVLGTAGLALDLGLAYLAKTRLQNALDASALSGAKTLNDNFDPELAAAAARATFQLNRNGLPDTLVPVVEMSATLSPFVPGGADPRFLRVSVKDMPLPLSFARVLPGVGESLAIGGSAVGGPIVLGGEICGGIPAAICGTPGDSDCSDGACFGLGGTGEEMEIKGRHSEIGPGNYGLMSLSCGFGGACMREGMAGGTEVCFKDGGTVTTKPGMSNGPSSQGLNTRFGRYRGPVSAAEYPPDVVTTRGIDYDAYRTRLANAGSWNFPEGVPQRRVVPVPVIDCSTPVQGRSEVRVLGAACFFLTRPMDQSDGTLYGQFVGNCRGSGDVVEEPGSSGPIKIVLYQDPDAAA